MSPEPNEQDVAARLTDLHYVLLRELPNAGAKMHGSPLVASTRHLTGRVNAAFPGAGYASSGVAAELRALKTIGLAETVLHLSGRTLGWQRTRHAAELLAARDAQIVETDVVAQLPRRYPSPSAAEEV